MKNLFLYWLFLIIPAPFIWYMFYANEYGNFPIYLLIVYFLIYKPLLDARRLVALGVLTPAQWWKVYIPTEQINWTYQLYFKK